MASYQSDDNNYNGDGDNNNGDDDSENSQENLPFKCSFCPERFASKPIRDRHCFWTHKNKCALQCRFCNYTALNISDLVNHNKESHSDKIRSGIIAPVRSEAERKKKRQKSYTLRNISDEERIKTSFGGDLIIKRLFNQSADNVCIYSLFDTLRYGKNYISLIILPLLYRGEIFSFFTNYFRHKGPFRLVKKILFSFYLLFLFSYHIALFCDFIRSHVDDKNNEIIDEEDTRYIHIISMKKKYFIFRPIPIKSREIILHNTSNTALEVAIEDI